MKKIVLLCAGGMSTSILVNKMKKAAEELGKDYFIDAFAIDSAETTAADADCVLLGPQAVYRKNEIEALISCPVEGIDMVTYGMMDGKKALDQAMRLIGEK